MPTDCPAGGLRAPGGRGAPSVGGSAPSASSGSRHPEASQALPAADGKRGAPVTCFQLSGGRFLLAASQALHPPPTQTYVLPPEPQMKPYDPLTSDTQPCQGPPQTRGQRVERRSLLLCRLPQASLPAEGEAQRSQGVYTQPAVYTTARGPSHPPPAAALILVAQFTPCPWLLLRSHQS